MNISTRLIDLERRAAVVRQAADRMEKPQLDLDAVRLGLVALEAENIASMSPGQREVHRRNLERRASAPTPTNRYERIKQEWAALALTAFDR